LCFRELVSGAFKPLGLNICTEFAIIVVSICYGTLALKWFRVESMKSLNISVLFLHS